MGKQFRWLGICVSVLLTGCSWISGDDYYYDNIDTTNLAQLQNVRGRPMNPISSPNKVELGSLRIKVLEDTAMSLAAQAGLASASLQINENMRHDKKYLDTIFNFDAMMLSHGVIPPVLEQGDNTLNLADPNTIRVSDRMYKIIAQARFATTPPNWREYLVLTYAKPELPDRSLLPRNGAEQKVWRRAIVAGWNSGNDQAHNIFQQNLSRLKRDFRGMALYRKLLQENMISPPFVARTELGVTGNGDDMRINDQVLRIVELPKLQTSSNSWRPVVVPGHE